MTVVEGWFGGTKFSRVPAVADLAPGLLNSLADNITMSSKVCVWDGRRRAGGGRGGEAGRAGAGGGGGAGWGGGGGCAFTRQLHHRFHWDPQVPLGSTLDCWPVVPACQN